MDTQIILGISFSTRVLGLAVFKSNSLVDYSLSLRKGKWTREKRDLIVASLSSCVSTHYVTEIALSIPEEYHQTTEFKELLSAIITFAVMNNIPYTAYPIADVYRSFGSHIRRTREGLMKRLVLLIPELATYHEREQENRNKYYVKLFEAVGTASHHWKENSK
ncbi:MAG: hypothetical protein V4721_06775 [Bacteroidota bacterium]